MKHIKLILILGILSGCSKQIRYTPKKLSFRDAKIAIEDIVMEQTQHKKNRNIVFYKDSFEVTHGDFKISRIKYNEIGEVKLKIKLKYLWKLGSEKDRSYVVFLISEDMKVMLRLPTNSKKKAHDFIDAIHFINIKCKSMNMNKKYRDNIKSA